MATPMRSRVLSRLDYCNSLLAGITEDNIQQLQRVQNTAAKIIAKKKKHDHVLSIRRWDNLRKTQRKFQMSIFKRMGVPGPEPNFLFGNLLEFRHTAQYVKHQEWREKYGKTYGYFEGPSAVLVTSDTDLLHEVFVKQFNKFHARKLWPVQVDPDKDEDVHMFFARGQRWKRLRNVVNPAFSSSKMRKLMPMMNDCINHLLDVFKDTSCSQKTVDVMELFRRLTLDTILRCEIGIDQNSVKNPNDPFLRNCKGVIEDTAKMSWLYMLGYMFPTLHFIWIRIYKFLHNLKFNPVYWLEDRMREVIVMRRHLKETHRPDLVQQMLNARVTNDASVLELEDYKKPNPSGREFRKQMTNEEIVQHAFLFLLAGYETTSTSLSYLFYELSQNPGVQQRLRHEVRRVLPRGYSNITFEDLKKLTYLDYVIWETLRKYPLASVVIARQCMQPCTIGNLDIPYGMLVHANLWDVQNDPTHWGENPEVFNPLRFMPEKRRQRHPMAWMPFGSGPRACAGMKFALAQLKMIVAKLLRDFDFHPDKDLSGPLPLKQGATIIPANGVHLSAIRRESAMAGLDTLRSSNEEDFWDDELSTSEFDIRRESATFNDLLDEGVEMLRRSSIKKGAQILSRHNLEHLHKIYNNSKVRGDSLCEDSTSSDESCMATRRNSGPRNLAQARRESLGKSIDMFVSVCKTIYTDNDKLEGGLMTQTNGSDEMKEPWKFPPRVDDILANDPKLRQSRYMRRGSIQPELESVRETVESYFMMTQKEKELGLTFERNGIRYLAKRRGSG